MIPNHRYGWLCRTRPRVGMAEMRSFLREPRDTEVGTGLHNETTPNATLTAPQSSMHITPCVLHNSQPADGKGDAKVGAKNEQEGISSFNEAHTPLQSARVTRSATTARQHVPAPSASAEAFQVGHIIEFVQQAP